MKQTLDFLVVGAQKSGTTTLFHLLAEHPDLYLPPAKELPFFSQPSVGEAAFYSFLRDYYARAPEGRLWGKVSPQYMANPAAAAHIAALLPQVKLIALLRHPVDRAVSHYRMLRLRGFVTDGAETALAGLLDQEIAAAARLLPNGATSEPRCLLAWGEYGRILELYLAHFARGQLLVLFQDELEQDPATLLARVWTFLGVRTITAQNLGQRFHAGGRRERLPWLGRLVRSTLMRRLAHMMPPALRKTFGFRLRQMNVRPEGESGHPGLPDALRQRLLVHFAADVRLLEQRFALTVPWTEFRNVRAD